jgi:hypothetical protein
MRFSILLLISFFALAAVGAAQQELVEQKAKSGEAFGEKALKAKASGKTVGGGYRYGKKKPPTEMRESQKQVVLKEPPKPAPAAKKDEKKDPPLSTKDAVGGFFGLILLIGIAGSVGSEIQKEAAREQMFGGRP